ncbi:hypothetical protein BEP19_03995 [Ammoniphilus oxalaticus]|uniref:AAA+ ATPase domain-containing protein n=1 Tax=Ammoniphilus oxalaticus TaxID=66863 RepID=A0A419SM07_9BACL|nr:AAA family ATPase [Ammoniphilus oxalaticus]RKD25004.1 hypothetical protein BEP19_03995 [Ammoniphilus oxalaticus]
MADNMADIDTHNEIIEYKFSSILAELPGINQEAKDNMMKEFSSLSMYYKNTLLDQLEKFESTRAKFIDSFLFDSNQMDMEQIEQEHWGSLGEVLKAKADARATAVKTANAVRAAEKQKEQVVTPPKFSKKIEKKNYASMQNLDDLIGLEKVKVKIRELVALTEMSKYRQQYNLKPQTQALHMIFKGNPGTGKTTVARLLGQILHEIGVLSKGHVIELDRSHLVSRYQGDIEQRIVQYAEEAKGGILFIDEVYSLHQPGDHNDQGKQGIEVLLKVIEDKRDDFICIGAGYVDRVNQFLGSNPGLLSRFPIHIDFDDYSNEELHDIAISMFEERDYKIDDSFTDQFMECLEEERKKDNFANGRIVRNIVEAAIREQSLRLFDMDREITEKELIEICGTDFKYEPVVLESENKKTSKDESKAKADEGESVEQAKETETANA